MVLALLLFAAQGESVPLEWKFRKGDVLRYEMSQSSETELAGSTMTQEFLYGFRYDVEDVDGQGVASIRITCDRVKVRMTGMQESDYDSARDEKPADDDPIGRMYHAFLGHRFPIKVDPRGEILEVSGAAELVEKIEKALGDDMDQTLNAMKEMFTDDSMKMTLQMGFLSFPKEPVAKGKSWEKEATIPIPLMGDVKAKDRFTLLESDGVTAILRQETKLETGEGGGMVEITSARGTFAVEWDLSNGRTRSVKGKMTMEMTAAGQSFTTVTKQEVRWAPRETKLKKKDY